MCFGGGRHVCKLHSIGAPHFKARRQGKSDFKLPLIKILSRRFVSNCSIGKVSRALGSAFDVMASLRLVVASITLNGALRKL